MQLYFDEDSFVQRTLVGKRKRSEEGCSQSVLQGKSNCSATKEPVVVLERFSTEAPVRKKRKGAVEQPMRRTRRQRKATKPDTFASRYTVGEKLGEGGFGSVFKGQRVSDGLQVAIKFVKKLHDDRYVHCPDEIKAVPVEVALLQIMSQPPICKTVIQLIEWFDEPGRYILVLERPDPCKSLDSFLQDCGGYDTLEVKLIDFGCGDFIKKYGYSIFEGTDEYCPPEFILEERYHAGPATVWSLGVLMFRMVCGYLPFANDDEITGGGLHFRDGLSDECCNLIGWCLQRTPTRRPNLQQMQQHKWLRSNMAT
ncbi:hypothetical protein AOLI_G00287130 [Acnodon oligacanthus]